MATTATAAEWHRHVMAKRPFPTHVRKQRRRWALSQRELAQLLGGSESIVAKYERGARTPSLEAALALEVVFGIVPRDLFPSKFHDQRRAVVRRAEALLESLASRQDRQTRRKRKLLGELITRSQTQHGDGI